MKIVPLSEHPSNLDPTARIVSEDRGHWTIYSVRGGFQVTLPGLRSILGLFATEAAARQAAASEAQS